MTTNESLEISTFTQQVRAAGGSLQITLDSNICKFEGIKEGDFVKVIVKKISKR